MSNSHIGRYKRQCKYCGKMIVSRCMSFHLSNRHDSEVARY